MVTTPTRFDALLPRMLADLQELVTCGSPSADAAALAASARVVAAQGTRALGCEPELLVLDGCPHLRWRLGTGPRRVLVLGHHDTVWPLGTLAELPWSVTDGVVRGPGVFDMKAGLVQAFTALGGLRARGVDLAGVSVLVTGDEEVGSPSSADLIGAEAAGCAAVLVLEASADGGALKTGRKGASMYDVVAPAVRRTRGWSRRRASTRRWSWRTRCWRSPRSPRRAGHHGDPDGAQPGTTTHTVPGAGRLSVDVRALTAAEQQRVDDGVRALTPQVPGVALEVRGGINRPPLEEAQSAALFALARGSPPAWACRSCRRHRGRRLGRNLTAGIGVPTLDGLGAVGGGAHAPDEHLLAAELPQRTRCWPAWSRSCWSGLRRPGEPSRPLPQQLAQLGGGGHGELRAQSRRAPAPPSPGRRSPSAAGCDPARVPRPRPPADPIADDGRRCLDQRLDGAGGPVLGHARTGRRWRRPRRGAAGGRSGRRCRRRRTSGRPGSCASRRGRCRRRPGTSAARAGRAGAARPPVGRLAAGGSRSEGEPLGLPAGLRHGDEQPGVDRRPPADRAGAGTVTARSASTRRRRRAGSTGATLVSARTEDSAIPTTAPAAATEPDGQRDRLVVVEDQRRQRCTGGEPVAASTPGWRLHRVAQLAQPVDVPAQRAHRDAQPAGQVGTGPVAAALQEGQQPQRALRRVGHDRRLPDNADRIRHQ